MENEITTEELRAKLAPKYPETSLAGHYERLNSQDRKMLLLGLEAMLAGSQSVTRAIKPRHA